MLNENDMVKEYEKIKPLIQKIDSIIDICIRDCHNKHSQTFDHICVYDSNFTSNANNETVNLTLSDKKISLYESNKKLKKLEEKVLHLIK